MHKLFFSTVIALSAFAASGADLFSPALTPVKAEKLSGKAVSLVKNGKADAVIVLPEKKVKFQYTVYVSPQKNYAAKYKKSVGEIAASELQYWIAKATGATLPVVAKAPAGKNAIVLTYDAKLPPEGFRITGKEGKVVIAAALPGKGGMADNGIFSLLFGAFDFLERAAGIRFYYPGDDGVFVPKTGTLSFPAVSYSDHPVYNRRHSSGISEDRGTFPGQYPDHVIHMLRLRNGGNGIFGANRSFCHTPFDLLREKTAVRATPSTHRTPDMPCYMNPATMQTIFRTVDEVYAGKKSPAWCSSSGRSLIQEPEKHLIPFSPPDSPLYCKCKLCAPLMDLKAPYHAQSSRLYGTIISRMAKEFKAKYPDKLFYILPYYNYTEMPKGFSLPGNCIAQVCMMYGHSLWHDDYIRETSLRWIKDWNRVTGRKVYIYTYPMWPSLGASVQYAKELKAFTRDIAPYVDGLFLCYLKRWNCEFFNYYCHYKLMWNPGFEPEAAEEEFLSNFYGKAAAKPVKELFHRLEGVWQKINSKNCPTVLNIGPYRAGTVPRDTLYEIIPDSEFDAIEKAYKTAEKAVAPGSVEQRRLAFFGDAVYKFIETHKITKMGFKIGEIRLAALKKRPVIDGKEDDVWKAVPAIALRKAEAHHIPEPDYPTAVKCGYRDGRLYFFCRMQEPAPDKIVCKSPAWMGDNVEFVLEFAPGRVYQIMLNVNNKVYDAAGGGALVHRKGAPSWKALRGKKEWTLEVAIPVSTFGDNWKFDPAKPWRGNICRYRLVQGQKRGELSRFSTRYTPENVDKKAFAPIIFPKTEK